MKVELIKKTLFFLGAGFSSETGCLTSGGMFADLKKKILSDDDGFTATEKEALQFLISCMAYHAEWRSIKTGGEIEFNPNIEELVLLIRRIKNREVFLPYPITGNWADKLVELETDYKKQDRKNLFEELEMKLKSLLKKQWLNYDRNKIGYFDPLREFFQGHSSQDFRLDVCTLNNDLVIEEYFHNHNEIPWRGFYNGKWIGIDEEDKLDEFGRINLYKLHGSIDWVRVESGEIYEETKFPEEEKEHIEPFHNPYVIFGQGSKTISVEPFFSLMKKFNELLRSKKYIFVIGYSFFDPYINNLLFYASKGFNKLIIVNPMFGPKRIYNSENSKTIDFDESDFFRIKYPNGTNPKDLEVYIKNIQKDSFFSELPEYNYTDIIAQNIDFIPLETSTFIEKYFAKKGELLLNFIEKYEKEMKDYEEPF
ncbi:MAG: SIR2 family protein [Candidatus Brocadiaceae bacterium]|nr:SIR2 family protein [Candidatus Brocadiaceae bacterium]